MFIVTEDWITRNTTKRGGYKAAQLKAIGVSWPPAGGWKQRKVAGFCLLRTKGFLSPTLAAHLSQ